MSLRCSGFEIKGWSGNLLGSLGCKASLKSPVIGNEGMDPNSNAQHHPCFTANKAFLHLVLARGK